MTVPMDWLCPLCGRTNGANQQTCVSCQYWHRDDPPIIPAKRPQSTERPLNASESPAPPVRESFIASRRPRGASRGARHGGAGFGGPLRVVWAGLAACGLVGASLAVGWWIGLGASGPLQRQLQADAQALAARPVLKTRTVRVPVVHTVYKTRTIYKTRTVTGPAPATASPAPLLTGTWGVAQPIEIPVTMTNPANGGLVHTVAEVDTGSYGILIAPVLAEQLGLPVVVQSAIEGVGGIGPSTVYGANNLELGPFTWHSSGVNALDPTVLPAGCELLIGRDFLTAVGIQLRTTGTTWALVVPTGTAGY